MTITRSPLRTSPGDGDPPSHPAGGIGDRPGVLWPWYAALAAPFALCLAVLLVTGWTMPVFWGGDEPDIHWPLTRWFAERLPHFDPRYGLSATTPLMQLAGACVMRLFGPHLTLMRAINTVFAVVGVWALFDSLRRSMRHRPPTAALLTGVLLTSCYFFGYAFRYLTDDPALTFAILALTQLFRFADPADPRRRRAFYLGCLWLAGVVLTRQNYMFLCLPFAWTLLASGLPPGALAAGLAALALAVAPFAALALAWHGLVPPDLQMRHTQSLVKPYAAALPLMLLGIYTPFFAGPTLWRQRAALTARHVLWPALAALAGLAVAWRFPLVPVAGRLDGPAYFPLAAREDVPGYFAGWVYNAAAHLPRLHGNSLLFWLLLPAGLAAAAAFLREAARPGADPLRRVAVLYLLGLLLASTINSISAQKYYDAPVLLFLIWHARGEPARDPWRRAALGTLIFLFSAYFVLYVAKPPPPGPRPPVPSATTVSP